MSEMKLSEAIRLGAMSTEPLRGRCFDTEKNQACALGAAYIAIGSESYDDLIRKLPMVKVVQAAQCPQCGAVQPDYKRFGTIPHLNDDHLWTREQIADWIETIERAQATVIATEDRSALEPAVELGALAQKCI